jgi:hypothetical protein
MKNLKQLFIVLSIITIITILIITIRIMISSKSCDKVVVLEDGTRIECKWVSSYKSGFSNIHKCDNSDYQIITDKIKEVIKK